MYYIKDEEYENNIKGKPLTYISISGRHKTEIPYKEKGVYWVNDCGGTKLSTVPIIIKRKRLKVYNPLSNSIITLKEAAEITNLSSSYLSRMLRGKVRNSTVFTIVN